MIRYGQCIRLKPGKEQEYIQHHAAVWPGVLQKISECNISNYSIFVRDDQLFAYFEYSGDDFEADMKKMSDHYETQKWWAVVKPLMLPNDDRKPGEFWSGMDEIFHLD